MTDGTKPSGSSTPHAMFAEMTKRFSDIKFPSFVPDSGVLMTAHKRNMDALAAANKMALEGAQAVARRNMEIMQTAMHDLTTHLRELAAAGTPSAKAARQAELIKQSYEHAVANLREMSDLIQKSTEESLGILSERFKETMDEIKDLLEKSGEAKTPKE